MNIFQRNAAVFKLSRLCLLNFNHKQKNICIERQAQDNKISQVIIIFKITMYFPSFIFTYPTLPSSVFSYCWVPIPESSSLQQMSTLEIPSEVPTHQHLRVLENQPNSFQRQQDPSLREEVQSERQTEARTKRKYRKRRNYLAKFECQVEGCFALFSSGMAHRNHLRSKHSLKLRESQ